MPLFDFKCLGCGYIWKDYFLHKWLRKQEWPICQLCGQPMEKLVSAASFVLKGAGFYSTDYKKKDTRGEE